MDPDFSQVLFEDFLVHLYTEAQRVRGDAKALAELAPYLKVEARQALAMRAAKASAVDAVVIGSMSLVRLNIPDTATSATGDPFYAKLVMRFETNLVAGDRSDYVVETWSLARAATARSRSKERTRLLTCPNCAAPFETLDEHRCSHCDEVVDNGRFDWVVTDIKLVTRESRPPSLVGYVPERGTHNLTLFHPKVAANLHSLKLSDPEFTEDDFKARVHLIFRELNSAWNEQNLQGIRPYVSDGLHAHLQYWIDAYQRQKLQNVVEDATFGGIRIAKVIRDRSFDAITVRVWGSGRDFTLNERGKVVGGKTREVRHYTEYWTLIRGAGVRGKARSEKQCPGCGAELKISMGGQCEYCHAHVTAGEFDWVLSKIEQDDSYRG
jgi:hypothetical protein